MKGFNSWLNRLLVPSQPIWEALAALWRIRPHDQQAGMVLVELDRERGPSLCPPCLSQAEWLRLAKATIADKDAAMKAWAFSGMATEGIKAFCPTAAEAQALAQVELNVPCSAYRQPFGTFCVVLPEGMYTDPVSADLGRPAAAILRHELVGPLWLLSIVVVGDGRFELSCRYTWREDAEETVESHLRAVHAIDPECNLEDDEAASSDRIKRIALNACLLLTQAGCRRVGAANPEYERRLTASLAKRGVPPAAREANRRALATLPVLYGFDQHIRVYDESHEPAAEGRSGHEVRPHWRRGHWVNQPCGAGQKDRRLIFRPAVLVNPHLLAGPLFGTRVTVTTG